AQDGSSKAQQITKGGNNYKYAFQWSPDSKKILWSDRKQRLLYIDIETKTEKVIESSNEGEYRDFTWSPNSKYVAYVKPKQDEQSRIFIYELESGKSNAVTEGWYDSNRPAFSSDGKFLFFASNRDFNPIYSWTEWNHAYVDMTRIYFVTLSKDTKNPLAPVDDEVTLKSDTAKKEKAKGENSGKIDFEGIEQRIVVIPGDASNYWNLACSGDILYYFKQSVGDEKAGMKMFDLKDKKENDLGSCNNFKISADGKKMLVSGSGKNYVIDCPRSKMDLKDAVDQSNMEVLVNLKEEWKQIFYESWRQMRDCFYAPNMHEVNWDKMKKKYEVLLPYVNQRADLTYLIGEMIGELSTGHAYTGGGDKPEPKKIKLGLLGAELSRHTSGYYQINTILKGENWDPALRSPLTEVGVKAYPGNYILAVNGKSVKDVNDIYELLVNTADIQVELTLNSMPSEIGSWKQIVVPIADESKLYYFNWVRGNIEKVNKATGGKVGYIHIPDMGVEGLNEFAKYYYPQFNKTALIIDDRGNGGGNVSPMIAERLARQPIIMKAMRNNTGSPSPFDFVQGPKVLLMDNYSASDGDLFPYRFQKMKLGKTIGVRTWGGVVGIRGSYPFIDGGYLNKPEFAHYDLEGKNWVIEGYGVDPEIVIDNDPAKEYAGNDEQLNKAIEQILEALKSFKPYETNPPKFPDKSK
ncbi:MAG: PDZ domain-containing protein, partial [Bacteroidota bacterium]